MQRVEVPWEGIATVVCYRLERGKGEEKDALTDSHE